MAFSTQNCSVFVQFIVDTDSAQNDTTTGVYVVDNTSGAGATGEGSPSLSTVCTQNNQIAFEAVTVRPCNGDTVAIQTIGNSNAWGNSGQPEPASDNPSAFAGQAQNTGAGQTYNATLLVTLSGGSLIQIPVNSLGISVNGPQ